MNTLELVKQFHKRFVLDEGLNLDSVTALRTDLLQEELDELKDAIEREDRVKILDALLDIQYVLDGTFISFGMDHLKARGFKEVHRSNMAKVNPDGTVSRSPAGKILKPANWTPPDLAQFNP